MNVGLIGYGFMGGAHLAALTAMPGVTLKTVACRTRPSAEAATRGNMDLKTVALPPEVAWCPDWREVVNDPAIEAVDLCVPTDMHREVILSALARGKHVLCEKPMALTPSECDELLEAAATSGRVFMVAQVLRFMSPYREAARFVREAGRVERCTLRRTTGFPRWSGWLADARRSGGAVLDLLSHDLDQALSWFGRPEAVSAVWLGEVDTVGATLIYPNGFDVGVEGGWLTEGAPFAQSFELEAGGDWLRFAQGLLQGSREGEIPLPEQDAYAEEIAYFIACCRSGEAPTLCPPGASADAVRLATMVRASRQDNGRKVVWT